MFDFSFTFGAVALTFCRLRLLGALEEDLVVERQEVWRFFSCMFLHAGVVHLLANMFSLLFIGIRLEKEFGFCKAYYWIFAYWVEPQRDFLKLNSNLLDLAVKIGLLYVLSSFGGSLLSILHLKQNRSSTVSVGASGALFGLLGAMLSELLTNWSIYANKVLYIIYQYWKTNLDYLILIHGGFSVQLLQAYWSLLA